MFSRFRLLFGLAFAVSMWVCLVGASGPVDTTLLQTFIFLLNLVSPRLLKILPKNLNGFPMVVIAVAVSSVLALANMGLSGALDHATLAQVGEYLLSFAGAQQIFYASLKDAWKLNE